ncbi:MAG: ABC transporter substrate-binding protein [Thiomicrospira sp.]|uniref:ABC transporter substrate-binding protein n=1 Tax=Thiomicrospira sp. TaxID=935 RepID=UPI0019FB665A|nr:ABC transporter substrate-binding protein [Thiomicrospira sp.]MBE0493546.1 ABC transporter substrate-binding protein [Thiomicrospira sp.]
MLAPWLSACGPTEPLVVAGHPWPGYEIFFMARDLGWLPLNGMQSLDTPNASESMQAIRDGRAQAAMLTLDEMIRLCSEGYDLRVAMIFDISVGADVVIAKPDIKTPQDLTGKTIGYEASALGALMLHEFLNHSILDRNEIKLVDMSFDHHHQAWLDNEVDALITYEPNATKLLYSGGHRLFNSQQIPDKIFDLLVVTADAAQRHKMALYDLIDTHFNALHHFRTNPMDASHRIAKRMNMPAEDIMQVYRGLLMPDALANYAYLSKLDDRMIKAAAHLVYVMHEAGIIVDDCDLRTIFTNEFIPKARL